MPTLPTADPYVPDHGDPSWRATHYDLALDYDVVGNRLGGTATIEAVAVDDLTRVVLDLAGLDAAKVTVGGRPPQRYAKRHHRLVVTLREPVTAGTAFRMVVKYAGKPAPLVVKHQGDAGWEELADGAIVAGQPHGAPTWFPCNDRPDDKASYRIAVTAPAGYTVVSNGRLGSRTRHGSAETWVYVQPEPMSTYLATVQIGRYELRAMEAGVPMTAALPADCDPGFTEAFGRQPDMMAAFVRMFGPYPFGSYAVVVTDDDLEIPLESQGLSTFGRNFLDGDWEHVRLVAHELAHQWFGNAVTVRRWKDIWLHEGFACYAEWLWSEAAGEETADAHARRHHERLQELPQDLLLGDPGPELMFDDRVYKRGALTLHALRREIGDDAFFTLLREWVRRFSGGSVETADFATLARLVTGVDHADLFDRWVYAEELPALG